MYCSLKFTVFGDINVNDIGSYFVGGATITVKTDNDSGSVDGIQHHFLKTYDSMVIALAAQFGIKIDSVAQFPSISIYTVAPTDSNFIGSCRQKYDHDI